MELNSTQSKNSLPDAPDVLCDLRLVVMVLDDHKATDIVLLDLHGLSDATDYFVVASGSSDTHVRALSELVAEAMLAAGRRPHHVEGLSSGRWVLLDYFDFVIHVFHPSLRDFYQLERLWVDAPTLPVSIDR